MIFLRYVSGSAYKIVNGRAYHHGTMLISTQLNTLGDLLHAKGKVCLTKFTRSSQVAELNIVGYDEDEGGRFHSIARL
jgi:lipoate-protein ligase A